MFKFNRNHNILMVFVLIFIPTLLFAGDFRANNWGDTIETVKNNEECELNFEDNENLSYSGGNISGINVTILYQFVYGKLVGGIYTNNDSHTNKNEYIEDYNELKELLDKRYGNAIKDTYSWQNGLYKDEPSEWGAAISIGHLYYKSVWVTERTIVMHTLSGDNGEIIHAITYRDKDYAYGYSNQKEKEALDQL